MMTVGSMMWQQPKGPSSQQAMVVQQGSLEATDPAWMSASSSMKSSLIFGDGVVVVFVTSHPFRSGLRRYFALSSKLVKLGSLLG